MGSVLAFIGLFLVIVFLVIKIDGLTKEHKRLLSQFKLRDQENNHVQQLTYELAEECSQMLLHQLGQDRVMSRLPADEIHYIEQFCQAIPAICRDLVVRPQPVRQCLQRYCQKSAGMEMAAAEVFIQRHGRLITGWQKNSYSGYLQMCQSAVQLVRENSYKEPIKPVRAKAEPVPS